MEDSRAFSLKSSFTLNFQTEKRGKPSLSTKFLQLRGFLAFYNKVGGLKYLQRKLMQLMQVTQIN